MGQTMIEKIMQQHLNEDFAKKAQPNDIVIMGDNFGSGSSRQQAVDCFDDIGAICKGAVSMGRG